jgi:hypothetical protein
MATMKQKTRRIVFTAATVGMLVFGGIMAEKAYSNSIQAQQEKINPAPAAEERAQTIKEQLDPRKWDFHKRVRTGMAIGMGICALFLLVKCIRDTDMELNAEREKNKSST